MGSIGDLTGLVGLARRLLDANKDRVGQITTGMAGRGQETWVYGRQGRPCRRCGTPVSATGAMDSGERITFWCPRCQPAGVPDRPGPGTPG